MTDNSLFNDDNPQQMANATASLTREEADELKKKMSVVPSAVVSSVVAIILLVCVGFVVYKYLVLSKAL